jgi:ribosomal protein L35
VPRVKRSVHARKKRRKALAEAKGYWGLKSKTYTHAKEQVEHSLAYAYRDRKAKKRFKVTGGGKLLRRRAMKSHMLEKKSPKRKRSFRRDTPLAPSDVKNARKQLGI